MHNSGSFDCFCHSNSHFPSVRESALCVYTLPHVLDNISKSAYNTFKRFSYQPEQQATQQSMEEHVMLEKALLKFADILFYAIAISLYYVVGLVLAIPYTWLSGGSAEENLALIAWFMPLAAVGIYGLYRACKDSQTDIPWYVHRILFGFIGYVSLPIILNGASIIMSGAGLNSAGDFLFAGRYTSLLIAPFVILACFGIYIRRAEKVKRPGQRTSSPAANSAGQN